MPVKKGNIPWNKGKKGLQLAWNKGKTKIEFPQLSNSGIKKGMNLGNTNGFRKGMFINHWKKEYKNQYHLKHMILKAKYGKATHCQNRVKQILNFKCTKKSNTFQWAKKKRHKYTKNKVDYYQLCVSCHLKYDIKRKI